MNTKKIILWIVAIVVLAYLILVTLAFNRKIDLLTSSNNKVDSLQTVVYGLQDDADALKTANSTIETLRSDSADLADVHLGLIADTARLDSSIRDLTSRLNDCSGKTKVKKPVAVKSKTVHKKAKTDSPVYSGDALESRVVKKMNEVKLVSAGTPNLSYLYEGGEIIFCAQANGREDCHFPDLAMKNGISFSNFQNNQMQGYNWKVEPTAGYQGDYGVTSEGTFYVSDQLIQKVMQKAAISFQAPLRIKCSYTHWVAKDMTKEADFWVYKTQR